MPIYEYICTDCNNQFELMRSMSEADSPAQCEKCSSSHTARMLSMFYAQSGGRSVAGSAAGCSSCSSSSCSTCGSR